MAKLSQRDRLAPLVDFLSQIRGYEHVQNMFVRAVPALSSFVTLNEDHTTIARFKAISPVDHLSALPPDQAPFYLGHKGQLTPCLNEVKHTDTYGYIQDDVIAAPSMFHPST